MEGLTDILDYSFVFCLFGGEIGILLGPTWLRTILKVDFKHKALLLEDRGFPQNQSNTTFGANAYQQIKIWWMLQMIMQIQPSTYLKTKSLLGGLPILLHEMKQDILIITRLSWLKGYRNIQITQIMEIWFLTLPRLF